MNFNEWWGEEKQDYNLMQQCENLLLTSNYDCEYIAAMEDQILNYSDSELNELKANLLMNQVDRIEAGHNYTQTDIKRKLK